MLGVMSAQGFSRYVAIGDSQTEGLWDGDDDTGLTGFADRLAVTLDSHYPGLLYANLAVRGRQVIDVLNDQLPAALAMRPDLITVCIGMNDVTLPGGDFESALADLEEVYRQLSKCGATILTTTFPDVVRLLPTGRFIAARVQRINALITVAARRYGFALVDLHSAQSMIDTETWSIDKIHASSRGHTLFAAAAAEALNLPGSNGDWTRSSGHSLDDGPLARTVAQLQWAGTWFIPWFWRCLRGQSSGDGRLPKYPTLVPVSSIASRLLHQETR